MKGYIAFIDILGYQSFLENNSATESALKVLKLVTDLPRVVSERNQSNWRELWKDGAVKAEVADIKVEHLIFSDTIVLLHQHLNEDSSVRLAEFVYFTIQAVELMAELFTNGLPSRGVIHEGEFMSEGTCFAGKGIVESYRICSSLDFSGIVLSPTLAKWIEDRHASGFIDEDKFGRAFVDYLAPLKNEKEQRLRCLNWYARMNKTNRDSCDKDVIQFVSESFWAHSKDLPIATDSKLRNTCKLLRKFRIATPPDFFGPSKKISENEANK